MFDIPGEGLMLLLLDTAVGNGCEAVVVVGAGSVTVAVSVLVRIDWPLEPHPLATRHGPARTITATIPLALIIRAPRSRLLIVPKPKGSLNQGFNLHNERSGRARGCDAAERSWNWQVVHYSTSVVRYSNCVYQL
jgi:hypothetical protein